MDDRVAHARSMRDRLEAALRERLPGLVVHGARAERLPNTLSAAIPGVDANDLIARIAGVAMAAGAACHAGGNEPSHVLKAMGVSDDLALSTLRLTVGRTTTAEEIDTAARRIATAAGLS
jgi:cysteine desulfurase